LKSPKKIRNEHLSVLPEGLYYVDGLEFIVDGKMRQWKGKVVTNGKRKNMVLGLLAALPTIEDARKALTAARTLAKQGIDPLAQKRRAMALGTKTPTFGEHATAFMDGYLPTLKNPKNRDKWRASLRNHCKHLWDIRVDQVTTADILIDLKPIWKTIPVQASEIRRRIETVLDDATNIGHRAGTNPALWTLALRRSLGGKPPASGATRGSHASVPYKQLPELMVRLSQKNHPTARALMAIILCGLRSQEFVQMRRCELDLDAEQPTWTVPYARFKVDPHKQDYQVPLSPQLVAILREQITQLTEIYGERIDYIWPSHTQGTRGKGPTLPHISDGTMRKYLQNTMAVEATVHGFRASFDTWADDQFADGSDSTPRYHPHAVEFVLAHVAPGGKTKKAYRRGMMFEARIAIMRDWANFCAPPAKAPVIDRAADNVLPMIRQTA
jgi:integrase